MSTLRTAGRNRWLTLLLLAGFAALATVAAVYGQEGKGLPERAVNAPKSQHQVGNANYWAKSLGLAR